MRPVQPERHVVAPVLVAGRRDDWSYQASSQHLAQKGEEDEKKMLIF
jgi:hypothetical protein